MTDRWSKTVREDEGQTDGSRRQTDRQTGPGMNFKDIASSLLFHCCCLSSPSSQTSPCRDGTPGEKKIKWIGQRCGSVWTLSSPPAAESWTADEDGSPPRGGQHDGRSVNHGTASAGGRRAQRLGVRLLAGGFLVPCPMSTVPLWPAPAL